MNYSVVGQTQLGFVVMAMKKQPKDLGHLTLSRGVKLLRTLEGHTNSVFSVAFDRQGKRFASAGADNTIRTWDATDGSPLLKIDAHASWICSVAFDPTGRILASAAADLSVKIWDAETGTLLRTLANADQPLQSVAFDPTGRLVASCGRSGPVRVFNVASGHMILTYDTGSVANYNVAFDPRGQELAIASTLQSIDLWNIETDEHRTLHKAQAGLQRVAYSPNGTVLAAGTHSGLIHIWDTTKAQLIRTLEGHTSYVDWVTFSGNGRLLASKSNDRTIRLWDCKTWNLVGMIQEPQRQDHWIPALAFHPTLPILASCGWPEGEKQFRLVHHYELDYGVLLERRIPHTVRDTAVESTRSDDLVLQVSSTVHSTTSKIVMVGDSGVGKTGLGWRLAHGEYREHDSTHGQQFWVLDQLTTTRADGTLCEAVLWDLAGQPDYRLIHTLSIQDADLALILFDPTNSRDPLGTAEYWLRQLPADCPKILVAARVDRGHPVLTDDELAAFCRRKGIAGGWIATSARENLGLDELIVRMKRAIPWDEKPVVTTDAVFKRIKDFVLVLKESRTRKQIVYTAKELHEAIAKQLRRRVWKEAIATVITPVGEVSILQAIRNLSSQGFVRMLTLSTGEERILLVPELMNNLAASIVLEARRNARGLGAVEESRLFENGYQFRELEKLSKVDKELLIDGTVEAFLSNRLSYRCFREHAGEIKLLIFPDLMNLKKPQRDDLITEDGASYILTGSTENTFAGLVVLLGYTNLFVRTDQVHDAAWFESPNKEICGVRQIREENERTIVLLFSRDASLNIRQVFEGLVEQMLSCRDTHVRRVRPVKCSKCGTPVDRAVMARLLKQGKSAVGCENADCLHRINLPPDEPLSVKPDQRRMIVQEGAVAELRTRFEEVIFELSRLAQAENRIAPTCFISYAWGNPSHERWVEHRLAMDLEKAGIRVILDRWENSQIGSSIPRFVDLISKADRVLIVGTNAYLQKHENRDPKTGTVVAAEMDQVSARLLGSEEKKKSVLPLLLEGKPEESLPPALITRVYSDFRDETFYFNTALELLLSLYEIPSRHPAASHWRNQLLCEAFLPDSSVAASDDEDLPSDDAMKQALKRVGSRALHSAFDSNQPAVVEQHGQLVWLYSDGTTKPYVASEVPETYRES